MKLDKVYVDYSEVSLDEGTFITELTWLEGNEYGYIPRHYFIDYPNIKDVERQISDIVGGKPLVRYSSRVVLRSFINNLGSRKASFSSLEKVNKFIEYLSSADLDHVVIYDIYSDPEIDDHIFSARQKAANKFGNAL